MVNHPDSAQLVAYADGDGSSVDLSAVNEHVRQCAECAATVRTLGAVRDLVKDAATHDRSPAPRQDWGSLSAAIHRRRRNRVALGWTTALAAASLAGAAFLTQMHRARPDDPHRPIAEETLPGVDDASDSAVATLSRAVAAGRDRLSPTELRTMDALVRPIDVAIHQTRAAIMSDPTDSFLRAHLAELRRKRVSALGDFVDLIRSRG